MDKKNASQNECAAHKLTGPRTPTCEHSHEHGLAGDAWVLENLGHGLPRLLDPLHVARVHHEHHAVRLRVVVLPDAADPLAAAQVKDGHLKLALLQVHLGEAHRGGHILGIVWGKENAT